MVGVKSIFFLKIKYVTIAEIEIPTEDTLFSHPQWLGKDVSSHHQYANSSLAK